MIGEKTMKLLCTTVFTLAITTASFADTWTVDDDPFTFADFDNIQDAVDYANDGDEIIVYPGTYTNSGSDEVVNMEGKNIWLRSYSSNDDTFINGESTRRGILCENFETSKTVIEGFTIKNCSADKGAGFWIEGSPNIVDCVIEFNVATSDGGNVFVLSGNPTFENCEFNGGEAAYGAGVFCQDGSPEFIFCSFEQNHATERGGGIRGYQISGHFTNCNFNGNTASRGGAGHFQKNLNGVSSTFDNCSFQNNTASSLGGGIVNNSNADSIFQSCSFVDNKSTGLSGGQGNGGGLFNDSSNPHLLSCIFDDNTANSKGGGIYNWNSEPQVQDCQFRGNLAANGGGILSLNGTGPYIQTSNFCENTPDNISGDHVDDGTNCLAILCTDANNNGIADECEDSIWTVDDDGPADFDNIQSAINASSDGYEIIVMPGTYTTTEADTVVIIGKGVWLHSSEGQEVTFINGEGSRRGIFCWYSENSNPIIEGFTITNGNNFTGGGVYNGSSSSPTLTDCTFTTNTAVVGGGMYNEEYSSPTLTNCTFISNVAKISGGGGMYNAPYSSPTLDGCEFTNNNAFASNGGGMLNTTDSNATLVDCTFLINSAVHGAGMYNDNNSPTLTNCAFINNNATNSPVGGGGGMYNSGGSSPTLDGCVFTNNNASGNGGGGMHNWNFSNPTLTDCTFTGNNSEYAGGGMSNHNSSPTLVSCTFTSNHADYGGGMGNNNGSTPTLTTCTFESNIAGRGGAMRETDFSSSTIENCTFKGNMATQGGGAIWIDVNTSLIVSNSVFTGNSAMSLDISTNFGGAILNNGIADFSNCEFNDNSSGYGGAFHTTGTTSLTNCEVKRNIGKVCGGASFNLLGSITSLNTMYCGNLPDHLVGGWVDDGGNELLDTCIPEEPEYCNADCNQDYNVDILDLLYVLAVFETDNPAGDINDDGLVDVGDILILISEWGACP